MENERIYISNLLAGPTKKVYTQLILNIIYFFELDFIVVVIRKLDLYIT